MRGLECNQRLEVTNRGMLPAFQKTQGPSGVASETRGHSVYSRTWAKALLPPKPWNSETTAQLCDLREVGSHIQFFIGSSHLNSYVLPEAL